MSDDSGATGVPRWLGLAAGPAAFLLIVAFADPASAGQPHLVRLTLAATAWIAVWWFTEAVPIAVTSLVPLALFPLLGLASGATTAACYGDEVIFLFLGGFLLARGMETTGLHRRFALFVVRLFGTSPRGLVLGFMVATALVSMWISNTATAVMMLPVALAVLAVADGSRPVSNEVAIALLLGVAFAANIGGLGTPLGSPPNLVLRRLAVELESVEVSFLGFMAYGVPAVALLIPLTWWWLVRRLERGTRLAIELPALGRMEAGEVRVLVVFLITVALWVTRADLGVFGGWAKPLATFLATLTGAANPMEIGDAQVAILAALALFILPRGGGHKGAILDWSVAPTLPWGVLLLMGAGFAISRVFKDSGLTEWLGGTLTAVADLDLPRWALALALDLVVVAITIAVTEFASNTASANILLPCIHGVAIAIGFTPLPLMIACALAATTGFAMPAGTPPNALAFATGRIPMARFVRIGLAIDLLALVVLVGILAVVRLLGA